MGKAIDGKLLSQEIKQELREEFSKIQKNIIFSIIYVGQDPVIDNFISYKKRFGKDVGVDVVVHNFDAEVSQQDLLAEMKKIEEDSDAMIVQLPLPGPLDVEMILNAVPADKDVDVLGQEAKQKFQTGTGSMFPPVTGAMVEVLEKESYSFDQKNIVIVGFGNLVGKPFAAYLDRMNLRYAIVDRETAEEDRLYMLKNADLLVSGAGVPGLIQADDIKNGVALLDGGTSEAGKKIIGDIDPSCYEKAAFYTPVPGGIGPLTIAVLYKNILSTLVT